MYNDLLSDAYNSIKNLSTMFQVEPFEIVDRVHQYRMYWKPDSVKTLLLAESHVATDSHSFSCLHNFSELVNYPEEYVRFVYCLSYGDSDSLSTPLSSRNGGTPQFWKLFSETVAGDFRVTNNPDKADKRAEKISLLREMQNKGIWLMDCSIVGVYVSNGQKPNINEYNKILKTSFEKYCLPIIEVEKPEQVIVVGQGVYNLLKTNFKLNVDLDWIHQPQARVTNEQRRTLAKVGYEPL